MRPRDLAALDFPRVCARIAELAVSEPGREACRTLLPSPDPAVAEGALERTWQCFRLLEEHADPPLHSYPDIRAHLRTAAHEGYVLDGKELVDVRRVLITAREVGAFFGRHGAARPALADLPERLRPIPALESSLARALDDDGGVLDQASDELAAVRATIRRVRDTLSRRLEDLVARPGMADLVADRYVTIRNDRFVVPIRASVSGRMTGVVQDRSVSGETLFVEPLFAVELNNQLLMAVREEGAIVRRILADLTALLRQEIEAVGIAVGALAEVDALIARVKFARAYRCNRPTFSRSAIRLREARHPGLLFTGRPVTPVEIELPADKRMLVITGPNTGGKTVALKTLGLCTLMAQSGILIPVAEGSELPCVPAVFTDVGDEQNIERDLSTFSAHVANLREILSGSAPSPLILLDEPGVGTDPEEGAALAVGLLAHLERGTARVVVTTHYTPVKKFALARPSCLLAAVDFDVDTLTPCYRLTYHSLGRSLALPIASRLGLPEAVLREARAAQSEESQSFSSAIDQLEATRRQLESELARAKASAEQLASQEAESRTALEEIRQNRRKAWGEELRAARDFLRATKQEGRALLRELQDAAEQRRRFEHVVDEREAAIAERIVETAPPLENTAALEPPRIGDTVEVGDRGIRGELLTVDGERAWIQRGSLRFEVPSSQLRRIGPSAPSRPAAATPSLREVESAQELSLIGYRTREAVAELERFLDRAVQAGHSQVRIVHGIGSGALRRAVQEYLAASPYCSQYHSREGNEAVTVVEIAG